MKIQVLDNFYPQDIANQLLHYSNYLDWDLTRTDGNGDHFWTKHLYGSEYKIEGYTEFVPHPIEQQDVAAAWEYFRSKYNVDHSLLHSVYCNGLTYGTEAHQHTDFNLLYGTTVVCYLCDEWNSHWSGATNFYTGTYSPNFADAVYYENEIIKSVLPKHNRVVVFDGNIIHSVAPLSKSCKNFRVTLMFKIKDIHFEDLIANAN